MNIQGKVHAISDMQVVNDKFRKREFVIEYIANANAPQYPQFVKFECKQDNCIILDNIIVGNYVDVSFNLQGREWVNPKGGKVYFNTLDAWKIMPINSSSGNENPNAGYAPANNSPAAQEWSEKHDDMPF